MKFLPAKNLTQRVRTAYFISVVSISLVLFILGITALLIFNGRHVKREAEKSVIVTVFLHEDTKPADIDRITKQLRVEPYVRGAVYVSPEQATRIMVEELGQDFTDALGYNALPPSVELNLKPEYLSEDSIVLIKQKLQTNGKVKEIYYQKNLTTLINRNLQRLSVSGILVAVLMLLVAVALIGNAVRLSVHAKRFVIRTALLVGGTRSFVRKPFVIKTIIAGIAGASFSSLALTFLVLFLRGSFNEIISGEGLWGIVALIYACGAAVGGFSGYVSVNRYLNAGEEELYFQE